MKVTPNFAVEEFACHDGTEYPAEWIDERLRPLCAMLETIRAATTGTIHIDSGYRTMAYDQKIYEASAKDGTVAPASSSQHPQGRAADIRHSKLKPHEVFNLILSLYGAGWLPRLGGIGLYPTFVHVDVRPRPGSKGEANDGHLAIWGGSRPSNVA